MIHLALCEKEGEHTVPRKDTIHEAVRNALINDGWTITNDPFRVEIAETDVYIDLRAERVEDEGRIRHALVIEVKSFSSLSPIHDLEVALGQYELYRTFLRYASTTDSLYLAVSDITYKELFGRIAFQIIVQQHQVAMIVVDVVEEKVIKWIN